MTDAPKLSRLGLAALAYAKLGWRVFTCYPKSKKPMGLCNSQNVETGEFCDARLPKKDKTTRESTCKACGTIHTEAMGLYAATTDIETLTRWWTKEPKANVAIRCGDGLLFFDVDVPNPEENKHKDGEPTLALLEAENGDFPKTPRQRTGEYKQVDGSMRRGWQYAFTIEVEIHNSAGRLGPGVDIRGDGGYVVVAPSVHPSGVNYEWDPDAKPSNTSPAPAPQWLIDLLTAPKHLTEVKTERTPAKAPASTDVKHKWVKAALDGEYDRVAKSGPGTRNANLNLAAFKLGQLVGGNVLDERTARSTLEAAAEQNGWAAEEGADAVSNVISSGMGAGIEKPRDVPERGPYQAPQTRTELRVAIDNTKPEPEKKKAQRKKDDDEPTQPVPRTGWVIEDYEDHCEFKPETRILAPKVVRNAIAILLHRAEFQDLFMFNKRTQTIVVTRKPPWTANGNPYPRNIQDGDITGFQSASEKLGLRLNKTGYADAINFASRERDFDPVLARLQSFAWDGTERLDHWLVDYCNAKDDSFVRAAGAKWMIGAAGRVLRPGSKFDYMLILEGDQGVQKSTILRVIAETLGPDTYADRLSPLKNKDSMIELMGKVIVEVAELAAFKGEDGESIKRFLSAQDDDLRLPWDRTTTRLLRGCVFAGTVNPDGEGYLDDPTGGRRFWPVEVTEIDTEGLRRDAPQLWAEAKARFEAGEHTWIEDEVVVDMAHQAAMHRTSEDAWATKIDEFIEGRDWTTTEAILTELSVDLTKRTRADTKRVAQHMTKRRWKMKFPKVSGVTKRMWKSPKKATLFADEEVVDAD